MPKILNDNKLNINLEDDNIGKRIAYFRKFRGLTQKELSEKIGINRALVADYERGKIRIYSGMVARFAIALNITGDELLGLKEFSIEIQKPSVKIIKRIQRMQKLSLSKQKSLFQIIDGFLDSEGV